VIADDPGARRPEGGSRQPLPVTVLWFRRDLRLQDHPALAAARLEAGRSGSVVPVFVVDPAVLGAVGPNRRRFLAGCLRELRRDTGGALVLRAGDPGRVVPALAREVGARVVVSGDYGPYGAARDRAERGPSRSRRPPCPPRRPAFDPG
jgi:deoxyribodipyrimidine photo-lyase